MKKRILSAGLALALALSLLPAAALAEEPLETASARRTYDAGGSTVTWPVTGGNITFDPAAGTVTGCDSGVTAAEIPEEIGGVPVTGVGPYAFSCCEDLTRVSIPDGVTQIETGAFACCTGLTDVTLPASVTKIEAGAFGGEDGEPSAIPVRSVEYSGDLKGWVSIRFGTSDANPLWNGGSLRIGGSEVTDAVLPAGTAAIEDYAFFGCAGLTSVTIPASVTRIGEDAFSGVYYAYLDSYNVPARTVTYLGGLQGWVSIDFENGLSNPLWNGGGLWVGGSKVTEAVLPAGTERVGQFAFFGCGSLTGATLPAGMTDIGRSAFANCSALAQATIPAGMTGIGERAFENCRSLESAVIPAGVTTVGRRAFYGCSGLTDVTLPESVKTIESEAFRSCGSLTEIGLPAGLTGIGLNAFSGCAGLTAVTIPAGVTAIGGNAFSGCSGLRNVTLSDGLTAIGDYMFYGCGSLTGVTVPASVTAVGNGAFSLCSSLTAVTFLGDAPVSVGGASGNDPSFVKDTVTLFVPASASGWTTPAWNGYRTVACSVLLTITGQPQDVSAAVGATVRTAVTAAGEGLTYQWYARDAGDTGFRKTDVTDARYSMTMTEAGNGRQVYCVVTDAFGNTAASRTAALTIAAGGSPVTWPVTGGDLTFDPDTGTITHCSGCVTFAEIPEEIGGVMVTGVGERAFYGCADLSGVSFPDGVTMIERNAFTGCVSLTAVTLPAGVTRIGHYAFSGCSSLTAVTIPAGLKSIGLGAFGYVGVEDDEWYESAPYRNVTYLGDMEGWLGICFEGVDANPLSGRLWIGGTEVKDAVIPYGTAGIGDYAFSGCSGMTSVTIPATVTSIGKAAFSGCAGLTVATVPGSVTVVGESSFSNCAGLTDVTIAKGVTAIDAFAFSGCTGLKSVSIPDTVTAIGGFAFQDCGSLTGVTLPDSVTDIGAYAFMNSGLTSMTIPAGVTEIRYRTFYNCGSLTAVTIPDGVTAIGGNAFYGCRSLKSVTLPATVTDIGGNAFYGCAGLTAVTIPDGVKNIGIGAFDRCTGLGAVTIPASVTGIGKYAFYNCTGLKSVTVSGDTAAIGEAAFDRCSSLTAVTFLGDAPGSVSAASETSPSFMKDLVTIYWQDGASGWTAPLWNGYRTVSCPSVLTIAVQPGNGSAAVGGVARTSVTAAGDGLTYQWYVKNPGKTSFGRSSVTGADYSCRMTEESNGRLAYCVVSDRYGNSVRTDAAVLTIAGPKITVQPQSVTAAPGDTARVTVKASGDGLTWQWYLKNPGRTSFSMSSVTRASYSVKMSPAADGRQLYCVVTDRYGNSVQTGVVTLTMAGPKITVQPNSVSAADGEIARTSVTAVGDGLTYQWYLKNPGKTGYSMSNVTKAAYSAIMRPAADGRQLYCVVTDENGCSVTSRTVTISMTK